MRYRLNCNQVHGGLGQHFLKSLFDNEIVHIPEINEYIKPNNWYYDYKSNTKKINNQIKPPYLKNKRIMIDYKDPMIGEYLCVLNFIKTICGPKIRGNYKQSKKPIIDFNAKYNISISPYSEIAIGYYNKFELFDSNKFKQFIQHVYKENQRGHNKTRLPEIDDDVYYYEDIFIHQKTQGTILDGFENQLREYHERNVRVLQQYQDILEIDPKIIDYFC